MIGTKVFSLAKRVLLIFCAVVLSLSATRASVANSRDNVTPNVKTVALDSNGVATGKAIKRTLVRTIGRKTKMNSKLASLAASCRCPAAVEDATGFRACFNSCLDRAGVSPVQIAACAGSCAGSLVGCAVCLGVTEWVVLGCGQYCAWQKVIGWEVNDVRLRHKPSRYRSQQARLSLKRLPAAT